MRHHLPKSAVLAAGLVLPTVAGAGAATTSATTPAMAIAPGYFVVVNGLGAQSGAGGLPALSLKGRIYVLPGGATRARFGNAQAQPSAARYTLTVLGTNLSGKPDNGDTVTAIDADNASRIWHQGDQQFNNGVAKFSVPAGHFWLRGFFVARSGSRVLGAHIDLSPEITVTGNTTVRMDARAADSKIQFVTARRTTVDSEVFELNYLTAAAPNGCCAITSDIFTEPHGGTPALPLYVSPLPKPPRVGRLIEVTSAVLASPSTARGTPYLYYLAYKSPAGTVQPQRFVVNQARLATENARFYAANTSHGYLANFPAFPIERQLGSFAVLPAETFPAAITVYLTANPALAWRMEYIQTAPNFNFNGGQSGPAQTFLPGQRFTGNWGEYPLHPSSGVLLELVSHEFPALATATRSGDTLGIGTDVFSDNTPGHVGGGVNPPFKTTGSYQIDQNGTKVAGGTLPPFGGFAATTTLSPERSLIKVTMTDTEPAKLNPLSTTNSTVWTWWSAQESGVTLPPGWACAATRPFTRSCAVQPLLTLRYGVVGENLSGATRAGLQVVRLSVGHLQLAKASKITSVAMSVSFDGGKTWHKARITGAGGSYAAVFNAPAGALVTMRTAATDAAGASITQTITNAYQVATGG